jgi:23S rRNA (cytosine1962-C5)-methyltransferase
VSAPRRPSPGPPAARDPQAALSAALARRAPLLADPHTTAVRLLHGAADGIPGLVIERLGPVLVAQLHEELLTLPPETVRALCDAAAQHVDATAVYAKTFPRGRSDVRPDLDRQHHDPTPWSGTPAPPEFPVVEAGLQFLVRAYDGYTTGLFLDHRTGRARLRTAAAGRRVLNLFAYTCGHAVAAAAGGAAHTVNVDASRKALEWGKRNLAANGQSLDNQRFINADVFEYYRRARRQGHCFDWIVLDPPTFGRAKGSARAFALPADLPRVVSAALELLSPGGVLQLSVNHRATTAAQLADTVRRAAAAMQRAAEILEYPPLPPDFREDPDFAKAVLVRID